MLKVKRTFENFLKGVTIGIGAIIPGISGGTAAIIVGCFEDTIYHLGNFSKHLFRSFCFLFPLGMGAALGVFCFAPLVALYCDSFPAFSKYTFCILSALSLLFFYRNNFTKKVSIKKFLFSALGVIMSASLSLMTDMIKTDIGISSFIGLFIVSLPLAVALVLPAVSFSQMLLFFGIYEETLDAISTFDYVYLFPLMFGVLIGTVLLSKALSAALQSYKDQTYSFVFGFVIMSLIDILTM